ncbi:GntR family transcriptional regulator [Spirochaetia bacterium]|nr:GntR family transcriptional regulator [Spirochaetia bacterium]
MVFNKVEKQNISDHVFNALRQEILEQRTKVGEKLPSEGALSKQFGVSKASVKAALQRLATLGLVETRVGQGSFVRTFNPNQYIDQIRGFLLSATDIANIIEYRMYFEMVATRLAMKQVTDENYKKMEEILDQMDEAAKNTDIVLHGQLDYQFHLEIWRATQNNIFVMSYEIIGKMLLDHITILNEETYRKGKFRWGKDEIHRRFFQAFKDKDVDGCRNCYLKMFSVYERLSSDQFKDC